MEDQTEQVDFERQGATVVGERADSADTARSSRIPRWALFSAVGLVALLVAIAALNIASGGSVPGDALYSLKRGSETVRSYLVTTRQGSAAFSLMLAERRISEARSLAAEDRDEARKLLDEADEDIEEALADAEFLVDQVEVDRIISDAEKVRIRALSVRRQISPAGE